MTDYTACSYPSHRAHDWRYSPDAPAACGVCHPPADPSAAQWVAPRPGAVLAELEVVIERGREAFVEVGRALLRISPDPPIGWLGGVKLVRRGVVAVREAAWSCA